MENIIKRTNEITNIYISLMKQRLLSLLIFTFDDKNIFHFDISNIQFCDIRRLESLVPNGQK